MNVVVDAGDCHDGNRPFLRSGKFSDNLESAYFGQLQVNDRSIDEYTTVVQDGTRFLCVLAVMTEYPAVFRKGERAVKNSGSSSTRRTVFDMGVRKVCSFWRSDSEPVGSAFDLGCCWQACLS
jgi:hypothetical protein